MKDSVRNLVRDLVDAGIGSDLIGRVAEMIAVGPAEGAIGTTEQVQRSAGAMRTARWRARLAASQASHGDVTVTRRDAGDADVTAAASHLREVEKPANPGVSGGFHRDRQMELRLLRDVTGVTSVTSVTVRGKRRNPPKNPLRRKYPPQKGSPSVTAVTADARQLHRPNWRHADDPLFATLQVMRWGRRRPNLVDKAGGWEFPARLIIEAEELCQASTLPGTLAHGPPKAAAG